MKKVDLKIFNKILRLAFFFSETKLSNKFIELYCRKEDKGISKKIIIDFANNNNLRFRKNRKYIKQRMKKCFNQKH